MDSGLVWPASSDISSGSKSSRSAWATVFRPLEFVNLPFREAMDVQILCICICQCRMYLYFLVFFNKELVICIGSVNGLVFRNRYLTFFGIDTCLVFFRETFGWSARTVVWLSSLVYHFFFFNAFSLTFEREWFLRIVQNIKLQFKIWQTFISCNFVHFQGNIFVARVTFLFSIKFTVSDFSCRSKVNRDKLALTNRRRKCKKGKRLTITGNLYERNIGETSLDRSRARD